MADQVMVSCRNFPGESQAKERNCEAYFHTRASVSASSPNAALMRPTIT